MEFSSKLIALTNFSRRELTVVFFLCVALLIGVATKCIVDFHWNSPENKIVQPTNLLLPKNENLRRKRFQLDLNNAEWYELSVLPGIGKTRAKAIVAYRNEHGEFKDIKQLNNVKGISGSVIEAIRDYVLVGGLGDSR